ncbi:MAG TPA: hypothetical protein VFE88_03490 [Candidatus Nanoarchaeia archaeon]|nr:hypothetical protein [Candidatus Nanoarchaeia archaeon]
MLFDWFKKRNEESINLVKVHDHLKNSFGLVKKDIQDIGLWVKQLHENHEKHSSRVDHHEKRLQQVEKEIKELYFLLNAEKFSNSVEEVEETEKIQEADDVFNLPQAAKSFTGLRNRDKDVFKKLSRLVREKGKNVHLRDLAQEVYPGKDFEKVRTTLANYITTLELFDFVYRKRVGREVYLDLTEKGKLFVKQVDAELKNNSKKSSKIKVVRRV